MPPQQTNLTSETERDAAGLGLDLSIALVKDAMGEALAAARPNASIAALRDDASSDKDAAGPTAASTRSVLSLLKRYWRAFQERRQRQSLRASLHDLSDRELMDIGVTRDEIDCIVPSPGYRHAQRWHDASMDPVPWCDVTDGKSPPILRATVICGHARCEQSWPLPLPKPLLATLSPSWKGRPDEAPASTLSRALPRPRRPHGRAGWSAMPYQDEMGQKAKYSPRVDVFRFAPDSGHNSDIAPCPLCAQFQPRATLPPTRAVVYERIATERADSPQERIGGVDGGGG